MRLAAIIGTLLGVNQVAAIPWISNPETSPEKDIVLATRIRRSAPETQPTLHPIVPRTEHSARKESLGLQRFGQLFYASHHNEGISVGMGARLSMNFMFPSLILDHARESYQDVYCDGRTMALNFHTQEYYEHVKAEWTMHREMVVITSERGCASYTDGGHHTYFKGVDLAFDDANLGLTLRGEHMDFEHIIEDAHLEFGQMEHHAPYQQELKARDALPAAAKTTTTTSKKTTTTSTSKSTSKSTSSSTITNKVVAATTSSSTTSTSTTTTSAGPTACGPLASSTISGMPAAICTAGFDKTLDDALGFYSFDDASMGDTWAMLAPGASTDDFINPADLTTPPADGPVRRKGFSFKFTLPAAIKSIGKSIAKAAVSAVKTINSVSNAIKSLPAKIVSVAKAVAKFAVALISGHPSISLSIPMKYKMGGLDYSPWGRAKLIHVWKKNEKATPKKNDAKTKAQKKKEGPDMTPDNLGDLPHIGIYCVDCGFNGTFKATGAIGFGITGIKNATLDMGGDLDIGGYIGASFQAIKTAPIAKRQLFSTGVPGFSIPKIVALGPVLTVQVGLNYYVKAIGQILAGFKMHFRNAQTHIDFLSPSKCFSKGWRPTVTGRAEVKAELSAGLVFELPIGVMFGIDVLNGKFKKSAGALVDTTALELEAKIEASHDLVSGESELNDGKCNGVGWNLTLNNELNFDVIGLKNYKIFEVKLPIAEGCIGRDRSGNKANPNNSPVVGGPGPALGSCPTGDRFSNGDVSQGLGTMGNGWYVWADGTDPRNSYDASQGYLKGVQVTDPQYQDPYSVVAFRQDVILCPGVTYEFSFDYQFDRQEGDVYTYAGFYWEDGTDTNTFGTRSLGDNDAIGKWKSYKNRFVAKSTKAIFQILTIACAFEETTTLYDNFKLVSVPASSRRSIGARQSDDSDSGTTTDDDNIVLTDTVDGTDIEDLDTPNPDDINPYQPDGSLTPPPNDSDIAIWNDATAARIADEASADHDDAIAALLTQYPPGGTVPDGQNTFPALPDANNITFLNLPTTDNAAQLSAGADGNLYLEPVDASSPSGIFSASEGVYSADFQGRMFHVYPEELKALNVSRLRLSDETNTPKGSKIVGLFGVNAAGTNLMLASDTTGAITYLAACNLQNQQTKIFVVQDPVAGLDVLKSAVASWTVTGGVASSCFMLGVKPPQILASV